MGSSLLQRTWVTLLLLPLGLAVIAWGGVAFAAVIALIMGMAAYEYVSLFRAGAYQPSHVLVIGGTLLLVAGRYVNGFQSSGWILSLIVLATMTVFLLAYERGQDQAATGFAITLSGVLYLGWLGAYLISLRELPEGLWWMLTALPAVWLADTGAYLVGSTVGRHHMTPRLSPKKTWEGYLGGIVFGALGTAGLAALWQVWAGASAVTPLRGALLGLVLSIVTTLGDLGESMIKRQFGVKDSGHLLPGHGGAFDRIDSWLWGGVIAYYLITWLFI